MGEGLDDDTSSAVATKPKKKVNSELDDLVGEMAGRAGDEPVIIPRGAGIAPMAPGPIKADPIPGMDGELRCRCGMCFCSTYTNGWIALLWSFFRFVCSACLRMYVAPLAATLRACSYACRKDIGRTCCRAKPRRKWIFILGWSAIPRRWPHR